jgi:hypothetical protein
VQLNQDMSATPRRVSAVPREDLYLTDGQRPGLGGAGQAEGEDEACVRSVNEREPKIGFA